MQKRRQGVAGFGSFTIEPVFVPKINNNDPAAVAGANDVIKTDEEVRLFRVDITFRNNKGTSQVGKY